MSLNLIEIYLIINIFNDKSPFFHKISDVIRIYLLPSLNLLFKNLKYLQKDEIMILTKGIEAKNSVELITKNISCTLILALTSIFY